MSAAVSDQVLMICPHGYTGLSYYVYSLCRSLSELGTSVRLITSDPWIPAGRPTPFAVESIYTGASGARPKWMKGVNYLRSIRHVRSAVRQYSGRVVHLQISELPPVDAWLMRQCQRMGKVVVFTPHDVVHTKRYPGGRRLMKGCLKAADRIIVHNDCNRDELVRTYDIRAQDISVIPHGNYAYVVRCDESPEEARDHLELAKEHEWLLFFGDIRPGKGLGLLCNAMPQIVAARPNARLLIAGRLSHGLTQAWLDDLLTRCGALPWTQCRLGFVPDEAVERYYRAASLVVMPYESISESGVLRFAHSTGAVPVCSDLPEFRETVVDGVNGYLFRRGDAADLVRCVARALSAGVDLTEAIKQTDQRFGWASIAARTREAYERAGV